MTPPEVVQVGPWRVRVRTDAATHDAAQVRSQTSLFGHYDPDRLEITLLPGLPPDQEADTFLHEVFHALTDAAGLTASPGGVLAREDDAERVVAPLSTAVLDLLRRNPGLVAYLTAGS